jgi:hypothetical protein
MELFSLLCFESDICWKLKMAEFEMENNRIDRNYDYDKIQEFMNFKIKDQWYGEVKNATQSDVDECCGSTTG